LSTKCKLNINARLQKTTVESGLFFIYNVLDVCKNAQALWFVFLQTAARVVKKTQFSQDFPACGTNFPCGRGTEESRRAYLCGA